MICSNVICYIVSLNFVLTWSMIYIKNVVTNDKVDEMELQPFLKWPGGKRWLVQEKINLFPNKYNRYYEPFVGSGAVFFALKTPSACISDINEEVINLYLVMRDRPEELKEKMIKYQENHNKEYYYSIRGKHYKDDLDRAARMLYLNRTCFNGLYRVNKKGQFNVPIGTKTNIIYDAKQFVEYSEKLKCVEIIKADFAEVLPKAQKGDLIFADPPYACKITTQNFMKYNEKVFSWSDQERLFAELYRAKENGAMVVSTNANTVEIKEMYIENGFKVQEVERISSVSGKIENRGTIKELIITT